MVYYDSAAIYIQSQQTLCDKITAIDNIIAALEVEALNMAGKASIQEYSINDGQTIIKTIYRGAVGIASAIKDFETIRERYVQRLNGRHVRLVDSKNFTGRNGSR
jgi:hypothetical protein